LYESYQSSELDPSRRKFAISAEFVLAAENPPKKVRLARYQPNFDDELAAEKNQLKFGLTVKNG